MLIMQEKRLRRKIIRWGNGWGIRLTKADMDDLGLLAGDEVQVHIEPAAGKVDLSHLPFFHDGADVSVHHDRYLAEALRDRGY